MMLDMFRCPPLNVWQTRRGDAERHKRARREVAHVARKGEAHLVGNERCATCPIGAAHAREEEPAEWPDGTPIETRRYEPLQPDGSRRAAARSEERPPRPSPSPVQVAGAAPRAAQPTTSPSKSDAVPGDVRGASLGSEAAVPAAGTGADPEASPGNGDDGQRSSSRARAKGRGERAPAKEEPMPGPKRFTHAGKTRTMKEWADEIGVTPTAIRSRLKKGWSLAEALSTPKGATRRTAAPAGKGASAAKATAKSPRPARPKATSAARADERVDGALALIDEQIGVLEAQLDALYAAGNAIAAAAGVDAPYPEWEPASTGTTR